MKKFIITELRENVFYRDGDKTKPIAVKDLTPDEAVLFAQLLKQKFLEKWKEFRK